MDSFSILGTSCLEESRQLSVLNTTAIAFDLFQSSTQSFPANDSSFADDAELDPLADYESRNGGGTPTWFCVIS